MIRRVTFAILWTLLACPVQAVLLRRSGRGKERFALIYWRVLARLIGLRITLHGTPASATARPVLFIGNHSSWLDIVALGATMPGCFVAKGAIAGWPGISIIARLGRTIFVSRDRAGVRSETNELTQRLDDGDNLILFPEGTTSDGTRVLPFNSTFLAIAAAPAQPTIQPITVVYDQLDGLLKEPGDQAALAQVKNTLLVVAIKVLSVAECTAKARKTRRRTSRSADGFARLPCQTHSARSNTRSPAPI
ncbi:MAG: hypothetical protein B7X01_03905 [Acidiphilium sp. 21-62-4]|nr:MAG: hypothetical protein B7X01_03905 [Acidiphilium sp. 21-62-4]